MLRLGGQDSKDSTGGGFALMAWLNDQAKRRNLGTEYSPMGRFGR